MNFHLVRVEHGCLCRHATIHGLCLGTGPDSAMVGFQVYHDIERLHCGMGQIGNFILGTHGLVCSLEALHGIAILAGIDKKGKPLAWKHTIVGQSIVADTLFEGFLVKNGIDVTSVEGAATLPYLIPNLQVELHSPKNEVPVQWWRSVGHSHTAFVVETMIDELAHLAGKDPVAYRLSILPAASRYRGVLQLAATQAGWGKKKIPAGHAYGVAVHESFNSYVAEIAEVSLENGKVRVHRVVAAVDCGMVINPDGVEQQIESAIVYGLSAALHGGITLDKGRVMQSNFNDYVPLRYSEMPKVEVHIVASNVPPSGIGEPGTPPIAPAVANAVFKLTGKRLRRMPFDQETLV